MSLNLNPIKIAAAGLAVSLALGAAASADEVSFGYQKSELTTPAGAEKLYERINARAHALCGVSEAKALYAKRVAESCADGLAEDFVDAIGDVRLDRAAAAAESGDRLAARR